MSGITWLHLSDWHQKGSDFDRQVVRDALLRDIRDRAKIDPDLAQVDFVVFSGDLAFSGQTTEYEYAQKLLLDPVLRAADQEPKNLFCVPGNHDLNRKTIEEMLPPGLLKPLNSDASVHNWLVDDKKRARALEPFDAYREFVSKYTGQPTPDYASIRKFPLNGRQITLLGFNSAWMCARNKLATDSNEYGDYGSLLVGEPQIHSALEALDDIDISIAVLHHPFDWLAEFDRFRIRSRLRRKCHFVLSGHEHCPDVEVMHGTMGKSIIIPAGACYERRIADHPRYTNAYNFVHLNSDGKGTVYLRRWNDINHEWREDSDSYANGRFSFSI